MAQWLSKLMEIVINDDISALPIAARPPSHPCTRPPTHTSVHQLAPCILTRLSARLAAHKPTRILSTSSLPASPPASPFTRPLSHPLASQPARPPIHWNNNSADAINTCPYCKRFTRVTRPVCIHCLRQVPQSHKRMYPPCSQRPRVSR